VDFTTYPLATNVAIFAGASAVVWAAGTRLTSYAEDIAGRTSLSKAFLGLVLLGVATSLPEIATTVTAASAGNARLATNNLFGGVATQIAVLAVVDLFVGRGPLTYFTPQPVLLLQGVMLALLLAVAIAGMAAGDPVSVAGVGLVPALLLAGYLLTIRLSHRERFFPRWRATNPPEEAGEERQGGRSRAGESLPAWRLGLYMALTCGAILAAGWALASVGEALAGQTGLGASFVGFALVAVSTSLPEVSTCTAAVRSGAYAMAVSNILGTNCLEVGLFLPADLAYRAGPILAAADRFALFAAALGIVVTCIYLWGLLERRDRTVLRMGVDSVAVLVVYAVGTGVLFFLRRE
jgi:cation:H+ antiporter